MPRKKKEIIVWMVPLQGDQKELFQNKINESYADMVRWKLCLSPLDRKKRQKVLKQLYSLLRSNQRKE